MAEVHLVRPNEGRAGDDVEATNLAEGVVPDECLRAAAGGISEGIRAEEPLFGVRTDDPEATILGNTGTLELEVSRNGHVERVVAGGGIEVGHLEISGAERLHDLTVDLDAHGLDLGDHDLTAELADVHRRLFVGDRDSLDQVLVELDRCRGLADLLELDRVQTSTPFVLTSDGEPTGVERQGVVEGTLETLAGEHGEELREPRERLERLHTKLGELLRLDNRVLGFEPLLGLGTVVGHHGGELLSC